MTWLTPLAGLILALATVPPLVALYFLKLRRTARPIASTLLWKRSLEDIRANAPFQRLRMNLLLLLQLLVLGLLAFALAQPQVEGGLRRGGKTVLLIDNSASMNATDVTTDPAKPKTRLDVAKEEATAKVERLFAGGLFAGGSGEVMVIAFSDHAEVRCPFSDSRSQVLDAIRSIEPTDGKTTIGDALALARAFTTSVSTSGERAEVELAEPADLELFSDGRIEDLEEQALRRDGGENLRYNMIGSPKARNAGVVSVAAERSPESPDRIQVFGAVANSNAEAIDCDVQLSVDSQARFITPEPLHVPAATVDATGRYAAGREQVVFLPFAQPRDAVIAVAQLLKDDWSVDDAAALVVPPAKRLRVALVGSEGFVLRSLLEGMALEQLAILTKEEFEELIDSGTTDRFDVFVLDGYAPREGKPLPPGRYLSFGGDPVDGLNVYGAHERLFAKTARDEHPVFRFVNLDELFVAKSTAIQPSRDFEVLAEAAQGPIIVSLDRGGVRLVHVAFDPLDSNWPFLRSFVNFVPNALEWLGAAGEALALAGLAPGDTAAFRIPAAASNVKLTHPDGHDEAITLREPGQFVYGPLRRVGIYLLTWDEPSQSERQARRFAVNLLSVAEGRIQPAESITLGKEAIKGSGAVGSSRSALWPLLLGLALLMLLVEWWAYQKRSA